MEDSATPSSSMETPSPLRRPSSHLNLPPNMSRAALSIQTPTPSSSRGPDLTPPNSSCQHPPTSTTIYSDRFIPCRSSSNFDLFNISPSPTSDANREDGSGAYSALLRTVLFGPDSHASFSPSTPEKMSGDWPGINGIRSPVTPSRNIFRFKADSQRSSTYSVSPVGFDGTLPGVIPSPPKTPRKVPRSPYKVIWIMGFYLLC